MNKQISIPEGAEQWLINLIELKNRSDMTVKQIAEKADLAEKSVSNVFAGISKNPGVELIRRIMTTLGGHWSDIFDESGAVIGGKDLSLDEVVVAADLVRGVIDYSANVIFGACIDENMTDEVEVVIIATGFTTNQNVFNADSQNAALRQATNLSQKLDLSYNKRSCFCKAELKMVYNH